MNDKQLKMGSLFDGSGGFPLSGALCGVVPCWAAEVEPYPVAVTSHRFPGMKHLGDISKVNGGEIEPVDIITFGSPCQDLSVAGKRAGLKHEDNGDEETTRSGLFMEAVRIIKEMRRATNGEYPRFALWENVPGAYSSNSGNDFRIVIEELIKIVEPTATVPPVPKNGWPYADIYMGDGWSLAYRTFDAQYWGVPQRRRRIHLVADFRGECAGKVLFEREGVRGYFAASRKEGQAAPGDAAGGSGATDREGEGADGAGGRRLDAVAYTLKIRGGVEIDSAGKGAGKGALVQVDKSATLGCNQDQYLFQPVVASETYILDNIGGQAEYGKASPVNGTLRAGAQGAVAYPSVCYAVENHPADSRVDIDETGKVQTLTSRMGTGGGNVPMVMEPKPIAVATQQGGAEISENGICPTITAAAGMSGNNQPWIAKQEPIPIHDQATRFSGKRGDKADGKGNGLGVGEAGDPMNTLTSGDRHAVAHGTDVGWLNSQEEVSPTLLARQYKDPHLVSYWDGGQTAGTLTANNAGGNQRMPDKDNFNCVIDPIRYIVRRLTPTECARLQGFPDWWGHFPEKDDLTEEEYQFWLEVRNTHAAINGRAVKDHTKKAMLTWYNKLHTDSAEYKMWGNGIALPPALYCMQGMVEVLTSAEVEEDDEDWMF
jgi:DNA (cytosine-5)-methyltransferase 1